MGVGSEARANQVPDNGSPEVVRDTDREMLTVAAQILATVRMLRRAKISRDSSALCGGSRRLPSGTLPQRWGEKTQGGVRKSFGCWVSMPYVFEAVVLGAGPRRKCIWSQMLPVISQII